MGKAADQPDVLVLGSHPCAWTAAALVRQKTTARVIRADVPGEVLPERLVVLNPAMFELDPLCGSLRSTLKSNEMFGLRILADDAPTAATYRSKSPVAAVASLDAIRKCAQAVARKSGVEEAHPKQIEIGAVDPAGVEVFLDGKRCKPRVVIVAAPLSAEHSRALGFAGEWEAGAVRRYTFVQHRSRSRAATDDAKPRDQLLTISLDLGGTLNWAWMLCTPGVTQFAVEQTGESSAEDGRRAMSHWLNVLYAHGAIAKVDAIDVESAQSIKLPFAGALGQESVGNRALLIGPAGGFVTACAEDIYPALWSAVCAAEIVLKALHETHVQDALQNYPAKWGATLGDYLRGPQQNLRFLMPLIYRNQLMTDRVAEAILTGKSVVR